MTFTLLVNLWCALLFGALIGLERQIRQRHAGLRTNALVCVGSALFVTLGFEADGDASKTRIAAQVVSGIGFLGAGVIIKEGVGIRGLNTAATLWCSAAVGTLCGSGLLQIAAVGTALIVATNTALRPLGLRIDRSPLVDTCEIETCYQLDVVCREEDETYLRTLILQEAARRDLRLRSLTSSDISPPGRLSIAAELFQHGRKDSVLEAIVSRLSLEAGVSTARWKVLE